MKEIRKWWFGPRQLWFNFLFSREDKVKRFLEPILELSADTITYNTVLSALKWSSGLGTRAYGYTAYASHIGRNPNTQEYQFDLDVKLGDNTVLKVVLKCINGNVTVDGTHRKEGVEFEAVIHLTRLYLEKLSKVAQAKYQKELNP